MNDEEWWVTPILTVLGFVGLVKLWQGSIRPWIEQTWQGVTAGDALLTLPGIGALDDTDMVGLALLALALLAVIGTLVRALHRRRRRAREEDAGSASPRGKGGAR